MAKVIDQDGKELVWIAIYMHYGSEGQEECSDLRDALSFLSGGVENGQLSPVRILRPSGETIERPELDDLIEEYEADPRGFSGS